MQPGLVCTNTHAIKNRVMRSEFHRAEEESPASAERRDVALQSLLLSVVAVMHQRSEQVTRECTVTAASLRGIRRVSIEDTEHDAERRAERLVR